MLPLISVMGAPPPKPKTPVNDDDTEEELEDRDTTEAGVRVGVVYCNVIRGKMGVAYYVIGVKPGVGVGVADCIVRGLF